MKVLILPTAHGRGHINRQRELAAALYEAGVETTCPALTPLPYADPDARIPAPAFGAELWNAQADGVLPTFLETAARDMPREIAEWRTILEKERPDAVISDADAAPLAAAHAAGIPGILVSNFTWSDLVHAWAPGADPRWLDDAYGLASCVLELPFGVGMRGVRTRARYPVPHVIAQRTTPERAHGRCGAYLMGFGNPDHPSTLAADSPTTILVPRDALTVPAGDENCRFERVADAADALARADFVIAKGSYGTITEAISRRLPIVLLPRAGGPEDAVIARTLVDARVACHREARAPIVELPLDVELFRMRAAYDIDARWNDCDASVAVAHILDVVSRR